MPLPEFEIRPLTRERRGDFLEFFEHRAFVDHPAWASCYCHYPHADHATISWKDRSAPQNREATCERIDDGRMTGWLAYAGNEVVGWCNAGPRRHVDGLFDEPEPLADQIGAIVCFVVAPDQRRRGVASALLEAACAGLRAHGFTWAEAYPRRSLEEGPRSAAENHFGPLAMFEKAGFEAVAGRAESDFAVRKTLAT